VALEAGDGAARAAARVTDALVDHFGWDRAGLEEKAVAPAAEPTTVAGLS
jgi:hypothetical protein